MTKQHDGGPAFPLQVAPNEYPESNVTVHSGMSLRDWFAGMALMTGICGDGIPASAVAIDAYAIADAMLAERGR